MRFFADLNSNELSLVSTDRAYVLVLIDFLDKCSLSCRRGASYRKAQRLHRKIIHARSDAVELEGS